ncbi:MAG: hypothetical protein WCF67_14410 [Chitinophagaceae bacterium]
METIFNMEYNGVMPLMMRCIFFAGAGILLWYIFFFLFSRVLYSKTKHHKDNTLYLCALWSFTCVMLCVSIFFYILIKRTGFSSINWTGSETILGLLPVLFAYLLTMAIFIIIYNLYRKKLKSTKII